MKFRDKLRDALAAKGWKYKDLARYVGVSDVYISLIFNRGRVPSNEIVHRLAESLGLDPMELLQLAQYEKSRGEAKKYFEPLPGRYYRLREIILRKNPAPAEMRRHFTGDFSIVEELFLLNFMTVLGLLAQADRPWVRENFQSCKFGKFPTVFAMIESGVFKRHVNERKDVIRAADPGFFEHTEMILGFVEYRRGSVPDIRQNGYGAGASRGGDDAGRAWTLPVARAIDYIRDGLREHLDSWRLNLAGMTFYFDVTWQGHRFEFQQTISPQTREGFVPVADGAPPKPAEWRISDPAEQYSEPGTGAAAEFAGKVFERMVPVISFAAANTDSAASQFDDQGYPAGQGMYGLTVPADIADRNAYAVEIRGDSMSPRYEPGEVVVVTPNSAVRSGEYVVAGLAGGERLVKRVMFKGDTAVLMSVNPAYEPIIVPREKIAFLHKIVWKKEAG